MIALIVHTEEVPTVKQQFEQMKALIGSLETTTIKNIEMLRIPSKVLLDFPLIRRLPEAKKKTKWEAFAESKNIKKKNKNKFRFQHGESQDKRVDKNK